MEKIQIDELLQILPGSTEERKKKLKKFISTFFQCAEQITDNDYCCLFIKINLPRGHGEIIAFLHELDFLFEKIINDRQNFCKKERKGNESFYVWSGPFIYPPDGTKATITEMKWEDL